MAIDEIEGILLGETLAEDLKTFSSVPGPGHHHFSVHRDPAGILGGRNKPRRLGIGGMHGHGKTEIRRSLVGNMFPALQVVL